MNNKKNILNQTVLILAIGITLSFVFMIYYSTSKSGFGLGEKTFMDWVELLIIPVTLAFSAYFFNKFDKDRDYERALDQKREDAIQHYFDKVIEIIRSKKELDEQDISSIKVRTLTVLRMLDGERKSYIVKFLFENGLIVTKEKLQRYSQSNQGEIQPALINLSGADLKGSDFSNYSFHFIQEKEDYILRYTVDFSGADLSHSNFSGAKINGANFDNAILRNTSFIRTSATGGSFVNVDFSNSNLSEALFGNTRFWKSKFIGSRCRKTSFYEGDFFIINKIDTNTLGANLSDFTNADLIYTNFTYADILPEQLKKAKRLWKTVLPNRSLYSKHHPLFSLVYEVPKVERSSLFSHVEIKGGLCGCREMLTANIEKIENANSEKVGIFGELLYDLNKEILKEIWSEYGHHTLKYFSKNFFRKLFYVLFAYQSTRNVEKEKIAHKFFIILSGGISFWKRYEETEGFTKY